MKNFSVTFELFYDASRHEEVYVKANTEKKAIKIAKEKLKKKYTNIGNMIIFKKIV